MTTEYIAPSMNHDEYAAWSEYIDSRPQLGETAFDYVRAAEMFLSHYRRGINLNSHPELLVNGGTRKPE